MRDFIGLLKAFGLFVSCLVIGYGGLFLFFYQRGGENEPLTGEYYAEQKRLWDEMNYRNKTDNASVLTNEQRFGVKNPMLSKEESCILALEIVKIMIKKLAE